MAEDAFVTDFEHIMADDITENVRFIMYDSASGKTASASEVRKYMMKNVHVDTTLTEEGAAAEAKAVGDALATKADTKGRYEDIVAGGAEQLMADGCESDSDPYLFRTTGGSADVGNREYLDSIVGGTVAWNQLFKRKVTGESATVTYKDVTMVFKNDGSITLNGTASETFWISSAGWGYLPYTPVSHPTGHVGLITMNWDDNGRTRQVGTSNQAYTVKGGSAIIKPLGFMATSPFQMQILLNEVFDNVVITPQLFDLTQMFGSTIADYVYSLEQATAGAGVAWFRNYFPKDYYAYNAGELMSVQAVSHITTGFNQWDEEWEVGNINTETGVVYSDSTRIRSKNFMPCLPNTAYSVHDPTGENKFNVRLYWYDSDKNYISTSGWQSNAAIKISPENAHYFKFIIATVYGTTYKNDICINLSDPTRNGEYEPYQKHTYPLDSSLTLRGVPKLVDGKLAFDGDVYLPSGEVQRRYGVVDLGTLDWTNGGSMKMFFSVGINSLIRKVSSNNDTPNWIISDKFLPISYNSLEHSTVGRICISTTGNIGIVDGNTYNTLEAFKTAMSGVYLVYEKATPTTETADGYEQYQICDPSGTEEFVTEGIVPVGHETRYPHDLKKKIETAPDSPSTDGTYLMKRSGGKNAYMALPSTPSANGSYVLTVTVSGGTASYSWTAKE